MYVAFTKDVLDEEQYWQDIGTIFKHFGNGRHRWLIPENKAELLDSRYCKDSGYTGRFARELYHKSLGFKVEKNQNILIVTKNPRKSQEWTPSDAAQYLARELSILVEDSASDGAFLTVLAGVFGKKLKRALENRDAIIEHGGGSSISRRTREITDRDRQKPRLVVLTDSDRVAPGPHPEKLDPLIKMCADCYVQLYILEKREMENYIPEGCIELWIGQKNLDQRARDRATCFQTFRVLSNEQKDFFDMKYGFSKAENLNPDDRQNHDTLFINLDNNQKQMLHPGFGNDVWNAWSVKLGKRLKRAIRNRSSPGAARGCSEVEELIKKLELLL